MLRTANFSVQFKVDGVPFREEYTLPYRTEEDFNSESSTVIQAAKGAIAKDLCIRRSSVEIEKIMETHNHLILD